MTYLLDPFVQVAKHGLDCLNLRVLVSRLVGDAFEKRLDFGGVDFSGRASRVRCTAV